MSISKGGDVVYKVATFFFFVYISATYVASTAAKPPNIIFILTDDQDIELNGMNPLENTRNMIGAQGKVFNRFFVNTPLCCPSRSSILTGKYVHNHGAVNNSVSGNCSSTYWQKNQETQAIPVFLKSKGYDTFFAGKYLNQYGMETTGGVKHVPPGWDHWNGLVGNSKYYNYTLSVDGKAEQHGSSYSEDYFTDVIHRKAVTFLDSLSPSSKPFFMMLATPACHAPFTPAPQYKDRFKDLQAPRNGSFNKHGSDKHWLIRQAITPMLNESISYLDNIFRQRWQTLLSVDDMVKDIIVKLEMRALIDNTYIFFTSDNGYHLGQFSLPNDKRQMYQFDVRVPLLVRGPGIKPGTTNNNLLSSIDLAPTFLEIADHSKVSSMDGLSFYGQLKENDATTNSLQRYYILLEHQGEHHSVIPGCPKYNGQGMANCESACVCEDSKNNTYNCMLGVDGEQYFKYCEFQDEKTFIEAYDLVKDPLELKNQDSTLKKEFKVLHQRMKETLYQLTECEGYECSQIPSMYEE